MNAAREARRRRILDAAAQVVCERGADGLLVDEVAGRARVGKGTIYNYFPSKGWLLVALADDRLERFEEELHRIAGAPGSLRRRLAETFRARADLVDAWGGLGATRRFASEAGDLAAQRLRRRREACRAALAQMVESAQRSGEVRAGIEPAMVADLALTAHCENGRFEELAELIVDGVARTFPQPVA